MKKAFIFVIILPLMVMTARAQFTRVQKKEVPPVQKTKPTVVASNPILVGTVIQPSGNFTNPSNTFTLPDGKRVTMTMRQSPKNLPNNFGGVVDERIDGTSKDDNGGIICNSEVKTINAQSSTFMNVNYNQQAIHIFPGAIYTYANFFSGNFRAMEQGRNPINISTDNLANSSGATFEEVQNPTNDNIKAKIATIIRQFSTTTGSAGIQYRVFTSDNDAELSIKLSAGGGYAGFKASAAVSTQQITKRYYLTIDAIKPLYTLTTSMPANGYFADKSVEANNQNLIVLKSVTYGTRVLANLEINLQTQMDDIQFKASFGADSGKGVSANASATFNYLKNTKAASTTANVYVVGGPLNTTLFETDKLQQQIMELISRCNYQTAQPIAYSFTDITGNVLGIETATDRFTTTKCVPKGSVFKLVTATVQLSTGKENKEQGSNAAISLFNSDNVEVFESLSNNIEFKSQNEIALSVRRVKPDNQPKADSQPIADRYLDATAFSRNGGFIDIFFEPKQIFLDFDTWNINSAVVTLTFMDQNGAQDVRQINFSNASALLQKNQQRLRLPFDKNYNAGGAFLPGL
ncbi:MAG TPA: thiol-activated cytolysin family protein [Chryseolinea sp.]|nr:thiol-activated cytolysin family protein [Chryseolinea sp.]